MKSSTSDNGETFLNENDSNSMTTHDLVCLVFINLIEYLIIDFY